MIPVAVVWVPVFQLAGSLHVYDTLLGIILVETAFGLPLCTFVQRNFYATISTELQDAARMDGLSNFRIFQKIILPELLSYQILPS